MVSQDVRVAERQHCEIAAGECDVWLVRTVYTEACAAAHHVVEADAGLPAAKGQAPGCDDLAEVVAVARLRRALVSGREGDVAFGGIRVDQVVAG
jgi:hypothetical protein